MLHHFNFPDFMCVLSGPLKCKTEVLPCHNMLISALGQIWECKQSISKQPTSDMRMKVLKYGTEVTDTRQMRNTHVQDLTE
jgi:hypothetical protein